MERNNNWIPLLASVGIGAATFYSMKRSNRDLGQTVQKMLPLVSQISNMNMEQTDSQTLGPHGMS